MATVLVPTTLREFAGGETSVSASGPTLRELVADLVRQYPALENRIVDEGGMRPELFIAVNGVESFGLDMAVGENDEVHILPAIAGGAVPPAAFGMDTLGSQVRICRTRAGLTQEELARRLGTSQARISRVERGIETPHVQFLVELCRTLNADMHIAIRPCR